MKEHHFTFMKATKQYYRFQETDPETGVIYDKEDPATEFNFGCIYLKKSNFQIEPRFLIITVQAHYAEDQPDEK